MSMAVGTGGGQSANINVTPLIDVLLVLLIIFMVITPMLQKGISVDMAKVNNPTPMQDADKEDALLVSVMRDGTVYFGADKLTGPVDTLTGKVKDRLTNRTNKEVYLKADARAHFGNVVGVVGGAFGVLFLWSVSKPRSSTPAARTASTTCTTLPK